MRTEKEQELVKIIEDFLELLNKEHLVRNISEDSDFKKYSSQSFEIIDVLQRATKAISGEIENPVRGKNPQIIREIQPGSWLKETIINFYPIRWVHTNFMKWNEKYRDVRRSTSSNYDHEKSCFSCLREWEENESMALANFGHLGNRTVCEKCATEMDALIKEVKNDLDNKE